MFRLSFFLLVLSISNLGYAWNVNWNSDHTIPILSGSATANDMVRSSRATNIPAGLMLASYIDSNGLIYQTQIFGDCSTQQSAAATFNRINGLPMGATGIKNTPINNLSMYCGVGIYNVNPVTKEVFVYNVYVPPEPEPTVSCNVAVTSHAVLRASVGGTATGNGEIYISCTPANKQATARISISSLNGGSFIDLGDGTSVAMAVCEGCGGSTTRNIMGWQSLKPVFSLISTGKVAKTVEGSAIITVDVM
ncbi:Uncharacterised protein [Serratia quinivorans]|uniref:hypothetical protein n=1 Tax=Serratia quinivorans TaxID=137545 RepID=UPI00217BF67F|nr:hypothetical protein [Serratia quinivorans]CAI1872159.1 Uncharacterised protein [Serratia quinivorans]CAI1902065.1 Uncharacterised protein [Serratia quinivorans]